MLEAKANDALIHGHFEEDLEVEDGEEAESSDGLEVVLHHVGVGRGQRLLLAQAGEGAGVAVERGDHRESQCAGQRSDLSEGRGQEDASHPEVGVEQVEHRPGQRHPAVLPDAEAGR